MQRVLPDNVPKLFQTMLVSKCLIEACRLDSHRSREVIQRGAFEALAPKDMHSAIQSFVTIEDARTACALWQFDHGHYVAISYVVIAK
jgi:hypothetical protein